MSMFERMVLAFSRKMKQRIENLQNEAEEANQSAARLAKENKKLSSLNEELSEKNGNLAASHRKADTALLTAHKRIKTLEEEKAELTKHRNRATQTEGTIIDHLNKEHPDVMSSIRKKIDLKVEPDPNPTSIGPAPHYETVTVDEAAKTAATEIGKKASKRAASPKAKKG